MHGWRFDPLDGVPTPTDTAHALTVRVSPLAVAQGMAAQGHMRDCVTCSLSAECMRRVLARQSFADPACEKALGDARPAGGLRSRYANYILATLRTYGTTTCSDVADQYGVPVEKINDQMRQLLRRGVVEAVGTYHSKQAGPPAKIYQLKEQT